MSRTSTGTRAVSTADDTTRADLESWRRSIADAQASHGRVWRMTPLLPSRVLSDAVGGQVLLKCENLQRSGSFKFRGAYTSLARVLEQETSPRPVVAASAGNHGQAVALACRLLGLRCTVFMPEQARRVKMDATREYGAHVTLTAGSDVADAVAAARAFAAKRKAALVHPYEAGCRSANNRTHCPAVAASTTSNPASTINVRASRRHDGSSSTTSTSGLVAVHASIHHRIIQAD